MDWVTSSVIVLVLTINFYSAGTIYVIGDSHASFCFRSGHNLQKIETSTLITPSSANSSETLKIFWLGPITMHRIGRDGLDFLNLKNIGVAEKDVAVFVFGEIDVRCHIGKQRDQKKRSIEEIVSKLVENYIKTIISNRNLFFELTCVICSVVPPIDGSDRVNSDFPFYGTLSDRIEITRILNQSLKKAANENGFLFLDISSFYQDALGGLSHTFADRTVHIDYKYNGYIKRKLLRLLQFI